MTERALRLAASGAEESELRAVTSEVTSLGHFLTPEGAP